MTIKSDFSNVGIFTVVFLIFLTLKLANIGSVAQWSWWWVTSPIWIPIGALVAILIIVGIISIILTILEK